MPSFDIRKLISRYALLAVYLLMTAQFVGCYLFLGHPYIHLDQFGHGLERLPFQTRLLLAPLFRWAEESAFMAHYSHHLSAGNYFFFPRGIGRGGIVEFYLDVPCVAVAGWVAFRIYQAASPQRLFGWIVYPVFLVLCIVTYTLHAVQNFRFLYDLPSQMFFALGIYCIYFRKPVAWLVALFAVATINRETTLFLIPFFLLSACLVPEAGEPAAHGISLLSAPTHRFDIRRILQPEIFVPAVAMLAYWIAWHVLIFHLFKYNRSEYYPRVSLNLYTFRHLRYYPQLFSACGYLLPFLPALRKHLRDPQLRLWIWVLPAWYLVMGFWGILVETRIFGELLPFLTAAGLLTAEDALIAALRGRGWRKCDEESEGPQLVRAA